MLLHAYASKVFVQQFYITMYHFQNKQLIVIRFHTAAEVQACISSTEQMQLATCIANTLTQHR